MSSHILCLTKRVQNLYNKYGSVTRGCTQYIDVKIQIPARSPLSSQRCNMPVFSFLIKNGSFA